jgi:hypothetical protein
MPTRNTNGSQKAKKSREAALERYGDATAVFVELVCVEKKAQFQNACQESVKSTLGDLYQSRREEVEKWLKSYNPSCLRKDSVDWRDTTATSWADQIGEKLQQTFQKLYVELTRDLDETEVSRIPQNSRSSLRFYGPGEVDDLAMQGTTRAES